LKTGWVREVVKATAGKVYELSYIISFHQSEAADFQWWARAMNSSLYFRALIFF
jgi:hypothetical protein